MEPIYDISGPVGALRVWNTTKHYLDVSEEGHLLAGETAAWVEETAEVVSLLGKGLLVILDGQVTKTDNSVVSENPKKKKSTTATSQSSSDIDAQPVVDNDADKSAEADLNELNNTVSDETV